MSPDITITLTYPYRTPIVLSLAEAREIQMQLNSLFSPATQTISCDPGFFKPLGGNGYEAPTLGTENIKLTTEGKVLARIEADYDTEAKVAEESPGTLREMAHDSDCGCNDCYSKHYMSQVQANGICNDPSIPVDRW